MARSTTYRGLTQQATDYISKNAEFEPYIYFDRWKNEVKSKNPITVKIGTCGMFDEFDLVKYKMKDGTWAEEFVQASPWSSGPHEFIALKHNGKEIGLWSKSEIDNV